ncbi:MAG: ferrochelatase [Deltaproteobacteria bacterium]|nr:ferrochelatase [Deltaproteobacteria bacterium]
MSPGGRRRCRTTTTRCRRPSHPSTDHAIADLGKAGVQRLLVVEPSFVADCLETLEEIGRRGRADFRAAGGGELRLCPSLNASAVWVQGLATLVRGAAKHPPRTEV